MSITLDAALAWEQAGCSVVRVATDGTKRPLGAWKDRQTTRADADTLRGWFATGHPGVGVVTGAVSGNLEMLELEGRAMTSGLMAQMRELADASGLLPLLDRVLAGYAEFTPSGGFHLFYRVDGPVAGNTKLARRPATDAELAENPVDRIKVLVETRGEGGFVVVAPSYGPVHPTGAGWVAVPGRTPADVPTLSADERDALHILAAAFDAMPDEEVVEPRRTTTPSDVVRPGDDFNARSTWAELLEPRGWRVVHRHSGVTCWRRPGKSEGISATTGRNDSDNLYVFTTSTEFESERPYSKFAAYALLEHGGDYAAAARALRGEGYGEQTPERPHLTIVRGEAELPTDGSSALAPARTIATSEPGYTDVGNAELLVERYGDRLRYVPERGSWLHWDGSRWNHDTAGRVIEYAKETVLAIESRGDTTVEKHRKASLSRRGIESMVALARTAPAVVVHANRLDADPRALCTPGGVVDLADGTLRPATPEDLHTRQTSVTPDPAMPTPRWDRFLEQTFAGDAELVDFVRRLAGYSATGEVTHHVLPFLHGAGQNGKSVFLDVVRRILGEYAGSAPSNFLMDNGFTGHETEIARLYGLRFVMCSEVNQGARFDEAKVKLLTGGDALTARFMRENHFTFEPTHHLWLMGNHQPAVASGGDSFWRRLRLVPFVHRVPDDAKIEGLDRILCEEEGPGILAWIVRGAQDVISGGLRAPQRVIAETEAYAGEEDALARFVDDRMVIGGGAALKLATSIVRQSYETWCRTEGERPLSPQMFGRELRTRYGVDLVRSNGKRFYVGVRLVDDEPEDDLAVDERDDPWKEWHR